MIIFARLTNNKETIRRIKIPQTVQVIGSKAFSGCSELKEVELCEGLLDIGSYAFSNCYSLKSISIPSTVTMISDNAFIHCEMLVDIELCEGLLEIREYAFLACPLKQITIPSTVKIIHGYAFKECKKLEKVELSEGLVEIGECAFYNSLWLRSINIPSTVKTIGGWAFCHTSLENLSLPDYIESIGDHAFWNGEFSTVRIPLPITSITKAMCQSSRLFSMELPESIERIDDEAFRSCLMLRNLVIPPNADVGIDAFKGCLDLKQLGSERNIIKLLKHRFDNLPIHKMLYYQSFNQGRVLRSNNGSLISTLDDPSLKHQDTLGMTPLHVLACSTVQNIEIYKIFIEKHPESLITKDRWGALPILYAVWRDAGSEIVQFLVQSYKSIFPSYELNWTLMMKTLALANADKKLVNFYYVKKESFPSQEIDWDTIIEIAILYSNPVLDTKYITKCTLRNLIIRGVSKRALALRNESLIERLRCSILDDPIDDYVRGKRDYVENIYKKLEVCEEKSQKLMEALTSIELVLWKNKMDDCCGQQKKTRRSKKMRMDDTAMRKQCRLKCGAETNIVIKHVLPYLDILSA